MRTILAVLGIIIAVVLLTGLAIGLLVLIPTGVAWLLVNWVRLPFSQFEATLLSLLALCMWIVIAWRIANGIAAVAASVNRRGDEDEEDYEDEDQDEYDDDYEGEEEPQEAQSSTISSIPKWRQPIRRASDGMPIVGPDDRCPCGSGRKYKNCHGRTKTVL